MYHWYQLIKKYSSNAQTGLMDTLIAGSKVETFSSIGKKTYRKLFWLGLMEFTPTALGFVATEYASEILFPYDYIIVGVLLSALLVKHLSKKAPELPFSLHAFSKKPAIRFKGKRR